VQLLEVNGLSKNFGGLAVNELDFDVQVGIFWFGRPQWCGKDHGIQPYHRGLRAQRGENSLLQREYYRVETPPDCQKRIARTFQLTTLYSNCSALENVVIGHHLKMQTGYGAFS